MRGQVGQVVLKNGAVIDIPRVDQGGGWTYRPDEARTEKEIRQNTNRTFGRGHDGRNDGREWLRQHLQTQLDKADWSAPASTTLEFYTPHVSSSGVSVVYQHPVWGGNVLSLKLTRITDSQRATISWEGPAMQTWWGTKTVQTDNFHTSEHKTIAEHHILNLTEAKSYDLVGQFMDKPIATANRYLPTFLVENESVLDWPDHSGISKLTEIAPDVSGLCSADMIFWRNRKVAEAVITDSMGQFELLSKAFSHLGVSIRFGSRYHYDEQGKYDYNRRQLTDMTIDIPQSQEDSNKMGHKIVMQVDRGISIECGYQEDEARWQESEKRNAAKWLQELTQESTPPQYEDYEYKPNV